MCVVALLLLNILLMASQLQYHGYKIGYMIGIYSEPAEQYWPHFEEIFFICDFIFALLFTVEMLIRLCHIRCLAFCKQWLNWIDVIVVISSWVELLATALPISPTFLRMLRLGKLLRALRVVKMSRILESLQLLLKCISASVKILFWSLVLLMIIQCSAGMTISYMVSDFMTDPDIDEERKFQVFRYYGTFSKTLLTMFEVLFANWAPACRVLMDNVAEWYSSVFIVYRCFIGFAVLNVVTAVFVQSTMKVAQADEEFVAAEKQRAQEAYRHKLTNFFKQVDSSGDGKLDFKEFTDLLENPKLQVWLAQLDIETTDLKGLFQMLDDGDGEISLEEFETGLMRMKGYARSFDLNKIDRHMRKLHLKAALASNPSFESEPS
ncbi:Scn11a [Symbiodinium pilosum]|uniref:Scn11a protein n=1 Tax=Symbiodinium pilosum TaxID=2952 RepID=A0A812XXF3_SYMPI|nr:Scn11a [Symbiodinium pilosum]